MYPDAPIYTSYATDEWRKRLDGKVITGYLQNWPFNKLRKFLPLLRQWWFASLDLSDYNLILSTTGNGEAKFIRTPEGAKHICYCHTPPHFYWRKYQNYLKNPGFGAFDWLARLGLKLLVKPLRQRDFEAAQKVDVFIANSTHIQKDIKKFYGRDSVVIHPPVDVERFSKVKPRNNPDKPFIVWGRHVPDKRIDLAIEACNQLGKKLVVVGEGPITPEFKKIAGPTITFTGRVSDDELVKLAADARAFIFTSEEDFGIAPVEAMAAGLPVIAYKAGGALDYIVEKETGTYFIEQSTKSLGSAIKNFKEGSTNPAKSRAMAARFSDKKFPQKFAKLVEAVNKKQPSKS